MTFSIYKPIQIFFTDHSLAPLLKCYYHAKTENSEQSSAKSFTIDTKSSERSLMYIRKERGPRKESFHSPALTSNHSHISPFSKTFWNILLKKLSLRLYRESETPVDLSLNISTWWQISSNALDISKNTSCFSRVKEVSKAFHRLWTIDNSWFTHE